MTEPCSHLEATLALADGELADADGDRARDHLAGCDECQRELADVLQLAALPVPVRAGASQPAASESDVTRVPVVSIDRARARRRRGLGIAIVAAAAVAAAAAAIVVTRRPAGTPRPAVIALAEHRSIEGRLSWGPAAGYRAYDVDRGAAAGSGEAIPLAALADLERAGDQHGLGALSLLAGDPDRAGKYLSAAGAGPDVDADRAALALARGDAETALTLTDAVLAVDPTHPAARWNHALALRDLGLVRAAAAELRAIGASRDPRDAGWTAEAKTRGDALATTADARAAVIDRMVAGGATLIQTGAGLTRDDAAAAPGLARLYLYDALRAAPDRDRAVALRPLAEGIDAATGDTAAVRAVERVAAANFARRAPLARTFAGMVAGEPLTPAARTRFLAALRAADQPDLLIGALMRFGPGGRVAAAADLPELAAAARATGDPWFELFAVEQDASRRIDAGDLAGVEARVTGAVAGCAAKKAPYRCAKLGGLLASMYLDLRRFADARAALAAAWQAAAATGDSWLLEQDLIPRFAQLHGSSDDVYGGGLALVRAYAHELELRRAGNCDIERWAHELVAEVLVNQLRIAEARRELAAVTCEPRTPTASGAFVAAHVVRDGGTDADVAALQADLAVLRAAPEITPARRALLDHVEGRALIDRDPARGEALLQTAIRAADALDPEDSEARKARAYSYAVLALAAAKRGDAERTLEVLLAEARIDEGGCMLGLAVDDKRRLAVVRGPDGATAVTYAEDRDAGNRDDAAALVPAALADRLARCDVIDVVARAPIQGAPDVLPPDRAWRYRAARPRPLAMPATAPAPHRVVVADTVPPASLRLPALAPWRGGGDAELVSGAAATPTRVVTALRDATWAELHAHGVVAAGASGASFLALSPDAAGRFASTAAEVRGAELRGAPVVVLAACEAARGADLIDEPWSLPAAFVAAGARAVIASDAPIPDRDAAALFDDLRARIEAGAAPAAALRDVRTAWHTRGGDAWVDHLMVFE